MDDVSGPVRFETKIGVVLRGDLAGWQRVNVTAFLVSGIAGTRAEVVGDAYEDADGQTYLPMFRQPVMVFEGDKEFMRVAHERAVRRGVECAVFTQELFATGNDRDNRAAVKAVRTAELDLVGIAVYGPKNAVDKVLKGAAKHP